MKTWLKGGILVAITYVLVQFLDDFFYVFFAITPLEKVRTILYLDFFGAEQIILKCSNLFEFCSMLYILILGFIIGCIIGFIIDLFNKKEEEEEIESEVEETMEGFEWKNKEKNMEEEIKNSEDQKDTAIIDSKKKISKQSRKIKKNKVKKKAVKKKTRKKRK